MSYRSAPGRPGSRLVPARGLLGNTVLVTETRKPPTAQQYGRECEKAARDELKADGWTVTHSHLSRGRADLVATKLEQGTLATTVLVQVKATHTFRPTSFNAGVLEILQTPPVARREVWGYCWGRGHTITVTIAPNGTAIVTGKAPYADAVRAAVTKLLTKRRPA